MTRKQKPFYFDKRDEKKRTPLEWELLAALKAWEAAIPRINEFASVAPDSLRGRALAAIAKAEGR